MRKKYGLKYTDVQLPEKNDSVHGYHRECYQKFTALSKQYRFHIEHTLSAKEEQTSDSQKMTTMSTISGPKPATSTCIFPEVCIFFCGPIRKKKKGKVDKLVCVETNNFEKSIRKYVEMKNDTAMMAKISNI